MKVGVERSSTPLPWRLCRLMMGAADLTALLMKSICRKARFT